MTKLASIIKQSLTDSSVFIVFYFIIFLLLIATFSDRGSTTKMFVLVDFFVVAIVTIYYLLVSVIIRLYNKTIGIFTAALLLFFIAELSAFTFTGGLPLFGLLQKESHLGNGHLDEQIYLFRQHRDFAFSTAGLASAILFVVFKRWLRNKSH